MQKIIQENYHESCQKRTRYLLNTTNPRTGSKDSGYNLLLHLHKFAIGKYDCLARELVCKEPLSLPEI